MIVTCRKCGDEFDTIVYQATDNICHDCKERQKRLTINDTCIGCNKSCAYRFSDCKDLAKDCTHSNHQKYKSNKI